MTMASGLQQLITESITFLNSQKYVASSIPFLRGTLTEKYFPSPSPTELSAPVPGKKSSSNQWKETVMTLFVLQKASSTPSPWCTSMSRYNTLGWTLSSSKMQITISLTQQNPLASAFLAWWQPPAQLITMSEMPVRTMSAASMLPPAASWQKWYNPSNPGQSKDWLTLKMLFNLWSSLIFLFQSSLQVLTISSFLPVTHFSRQSIQQGSWKRLSSSLDASLDWNMVRQSHRSQFWMREWAILILRVFMGCSLLKWQLVIESLQRQLTLRI